MPQTIRLHKDEKDWQGNFPISLNCVLGLYRKIISDLQHKGK